MFRKCPPEARILELTSVLRRCRRRVSLCSSEVQTLRESEFVFGYRDIGINYRVRSYFRFSDTAFSRKNLICSGSTPRGLNARA